MRPPLFALTAALGLTACPAPTPDAGTTDTSGSDTAAASETSSGTDSSETDTDTETETETGAVEVEVKWIEVAASDYKLELQPEFDAAITRYTALADGPDISVYVDVIVDEDVDAVLVNEIPAALVGFRTWRSAPETALVSPSFALVEVVLAGAEVPSYAIDITAP